MLTLTRRKGERIAVGNDVEITVLDVSGGRVRLGIKAPRSLAVHRGEVVDRIEEENRRALAEQVNAPGMEDQVITIADGLFGLRDHREFVICEFDNNQGFRLLVSRKDPRVQFIIVEAAHVWPTYPLDDALKASGLDQDVAVAAVVTAPADGSQATVNLLAPIVIGMETREGVQVILQREELGVRHPMVQQLGGQTA